MTLNDLLHVDVVAADGRRLGRVTDVRVQGKTTPGGTLAPLPVVGLLVSGRHTGSLLGYERRREQGPWLVRRLVRALHRGAFYVEWADVESWDASARRVRLRPGARRQSPDT